VGVAKSESCRHLQPQKQPFVPLRNVLNPTLETAESLPLHAAMRILILIPKLDDDIIVGRSEELLSRTVVILSRPFLGKERFWLQFRWSIRRLCQMLAAVQTPGIFSGPLRLSAWRNWGTRSLSEGRIQMVKKIRDN
jgi:hypothetical protein